MLRTLDDYHTAEDIAPNTWRIDENHFSNCYLLEGSERALLIDAACGVGDLRTCVEELTDKPVIAVATHRHPDHVGAMWRFGSYAVNPADNALVYSFLCLPAFTRLLVNKSGGDASAIARPGRVSVLPLRDGQTFSLGDRTVLALSTPGHTAGSMSFVDEKERLIVTGDEMNPDLWMHLPGCTSLTVWQSGADLILGYLERGYAGWYGHGDGRQSLDQARETRRLVSEVIEKCERHELGRGRGCYPAEGGSLVIRYRRI